MAAKGDLMPWIIEALHAKGGAAHHIEVAKYVWEHHGTELRNSGDLFYTWQYDLRWAGKRLRDAGKIAPVQGRQGDGIWRSTSDA